MASDRPQELETPSLTELIQLATENRLQDVHTVSWGAVTSYNATTQEANVQIIPRRAFTDEDGKRQTERPAPLLNVPVLLPGSGDSGITYPVGTGDVVLVLFFETPVDTWMAGGQDDVDAGDDTRRHAMTDAVAIAGLRPRGRRITPAPPKNVVVRDPATVQLGSFSANKAVLTVDDGNDLMAALTAAQTATAALPLGGTGAAAIAQIITALGTLITGAPHAGQAFPVGSSKVKADA